MDVIDVLDKENVAKRDFEKYSKSHLNDNLSWIFVILILNDVLVSLWR